jgi:steroid delta-isomerase-like uncharacterized protein
MSQDAVALTHRWFEEVWNQGREETIHELCAPNVIGHGLGEAGAKMHGPADFKVFWQNLREAFPDCKVTVEDTLSQGNKTVARVVFRGTHAGRGGLGLDPTGRTVSISGIIILRIVNGKIHEAWNSWDQLGLLQQIGAMETPPDRFMTAR